MCSGSEAGWYLRLIDFVSLNSRLESHKEEKEKKKMQAASVSPLGATLAVVFVNL